MKFILLLALVFIGCTSSSISNKDNNKTENITATVKADVKHISATGTENNYNFSVTVKSDETGCAQYADWWEVLKQNGTLIYRRVLFHSHPSEQPFTRSGGSIDIKEDEKVYIRVHMNNKGYTGNIFFGSVKDGFALADDKPTFSYSIETEAPLPDGCAF